MQGNLECVIDVNNNERIMVWEGTTLGEQKHADTKIDFCEDEISEISIATGKNSLHLQAWKHFEKEIDIHNKNTFLYTKLTQVTTKV